MNFNDLLKRWNKGILKGAAGRFATHVGVSQMTVSRWGTGNSRVDESMQAKVAKALGVSIPELMSCFGPRASSMATLHSDAVPVPGTLEIREVNYYGELCAGMRNYIFDGIPLSTENIFMKIPGGIKVGIFKVTGDCMDDNSPEAIRSGDKIVVAEQNWANPGDIIVCTLDGALMVKELKHHDGKTLLQPRNPKHKPITVTGEFKILGVVLRSYRDHKR